MAGPLQALRRERTDTDIGDLDGLAGALAGSIARLEQQHTMLVSSLEAERTARMNDMADLRMAVASPKRPTAGAPVNPVGALRKLKQECLHAGRGSPELRACAAGSLGAVVQSVAEAQQKLAALSEAWPREAPGAGGHAELRRFFREVRGLRAACGAALELGAALVGKWSEECSDTGSTSADSEDETASTVEAHADAGGRGSEVSTQSSSECLGLEASRALRRGLDSSVKVSAVPPLNLAAMGAPRGGMDTVAPPEASTQLARPGAEATLQCHKVSFCVSCSHTRVGLHVRVVGSSPALGSWRPQDGLHLHTSAADFPVWHSNGPVVLEADAVLEYKYVICDGSGESATWEERPNRRLHLASATAQLAAAGRADLSHVVLAEGFNDWQSESTGGLRLRTASALGPALDADVSTPRRPLQAPSTFTPTVRRHLPSCGALQRGASGLASRCASGLPSVLEQEKGGSGAVGHGGRGSPPCAPAEPQGLSLAREDSYSQLFARAARDDGAPGEEFRDHYELLGEGPLAEGTFGLVWRCRPRLPDAASGGREWAAKIVHKAQLQARSAGTPLSPSGEVQLHMALKHPHIVGLLEYFDESHTLTLVLEYCRGGDLFDAIMAEASRKQFRGGLGEPAAATVALHLLRALAYLHGKCVVHRDLKCENVLLEREGVPLEENCFKICDFGFAAFERGLGLRDQVGSPDTVAPEVVAGKTYSFPADLWSTGVVLYMALSADSPFRAQTDDKVLQRVLAGQYSLAGGPWQAVPERPKRLVASLMSVSPLLRPTAQQALQSEWLRGLDARGP